MCRISASECPGQAEPVPPPASAPAASHAEANGQSGKESLLEKKAFEACVCQLTTPCPCDCNFRPSSIANSVKYFWPFSESAKLIAGTPVEALSSRFLTATRWVQAFRALTLEAEISDSQRRLRPTRQRPAARSPAWLRKATNRISRRIVTWLSSPTASCFEGGCSFL